VFSGVTAAFSLLLTWYPYIGPACVWAADGAAA
jgi:hypothetical protein